MLTREIKSGINYNETNDTVIGIRNSSWEFRKYLMITINQFYCNLNAFYFDLINNFSNLFYLNNYNTLLIHVLRFILFDLSFHCYDKHLHQRIEFASVGNDYLKNDTGYDDNDKKSKEKIPSRTKTRVVALVMLMMIITRMGMVLLAMLLLRRIPNIIVNTIQDFIIEFPKILTRLKKCLLTRLG